MGLISGPGQVILYIFAISLLWFFEMIFPTESIDIAEDFNSESYIANPEKFGNHLYNVQSSAQSHDKKPNSSAKVQNR